MLKRHSVGLLETGAVGIVRMGEGNAEFFQFGEPSGLVPRAVNEETLDYFVYDAATVPV